MSHSSATQERWEIPDRCRYCGLVNGVTINAIEDGGKTAKLKCQFCQHVWRIEPTPVWKVLDNRENAESRLRAVLEGVKNALDKPGRDGLHKYSGHIHAYGCPACELRDSVVAALSEEERP